MINEQSEKEAEQLQNKLLKWYEEWSKLAVTKTAFNSLESIIGKQGERTKNSIIMACYNAAHYKESDDEGVNYRKQIVLEKSKVASLSRAAHILSRSAKADDKALGWANEIVYFDRSTSHADQPSAVVAIYATHSAACFASFRKDQRVW